MRPPLPSLLISRRTKILVAVVVILIALIIALVKFSGVYINFLWFDSVGHHNVYSTVFWTRVVLFFVFGVVMALIIGGNLIAAYLIKPPFRPMSPEQQNLQHYVLMVEPRRKLVLAAVAVIAFLSAGASAQGDWAQWQLFLNGQSFGVKDPQFGRDISFYAWDYPLYRLLLSFGFTAIIFSLILSVGIHYLTGAIRLQTPGPKITVTARRHLTVLVFVFMILKAIAYWLDRYGLVFSSRSKFTGASYTDVHSELPAKTILFWITIILAIGVLASIWLKSVLLPGVGFVVLLILSILIGGLYPAIVQKVSVAPNASDKERPYIERNILATRQAYNIVTVDSDKTNGGQPGGTVSYPSYSVTSTPPTDLLTSPTSTNATVNNIRITDPNVVSPTVTNAQNIDQVYSFPRTLDVDRYTVNHTTNDYVVGAREADPSNLKDNQQNWINVHTVYTHGYGLVAAEANKDITSSTSTSPYSASDIPTKPDSGPFKLTQPRIYFGQSMADYSIVGAQGSKREYDGDNDRVTYNGTGGVSLSNPFTRLAFALKYKETNFILNDAVSTKGAKIIFVHDPKEIVQKVAPFLTVDGDPYPVVDNGRIVWMVDGYTTMANYPYSEQESLSDLTHTSLRQGQQDTQINYIRNSVKATVDAYNGTVTLYQWDNKDPVLNTWKKIFPGLIKPGNQMPETLREHIRYPQDLFDVQRGLLAQYHVTNPVQFYNGSNRWQIPPDPVNASLGNQPPYYVLANSPGNQNSTTPQFQLTSPMIVNQKNNLAAYISADSDPANYGKLTVLVVNDPGAVQGPTQVANTFHTKPEISAKIRLLTGGTTNVVYGNLLTLPLGGSFLYVEPLYAASTYPTLSSVLVSYGGGLGYGATLSQALTDFLPGHTTGQTVQDPTGSTTPTPTSTSTSGSTSSTTSKPPSSSTSTSPPSGSGTPSTQTQIINDLENIQKQLDAAKAKGDYTGYAALLQQQQADVQKLLELQSSSPAGSSSSSPTPKHT